MITIVALSIQTLIDLMPQFCVRDPARPVRTKGRSKIATRINSGFKLAKQNREKINKKAHVDLVARRVITRSDIQRRRCKRAVTFDGSVILFLSF